MRTPLHLAAASIAAAALVVTAAGATAEPIDSAPFSAPATVIATGTGSAAVDSGSAAAGTGLHYLQRGDIIGLLVLLAVAPLQIFTSGICDLATMSALPSPCATVTR
ncbi:hypothetical protein ACRS6B_26600 [Nocardia asteroides]